MQDEFQYDYSDLCRKMAESKITSHTIRKGGTKENVINQYTYTKVTNNRGAISLDTLAKIMAETGTKKVIVEKSERKVTLKVED